MPCHHVITSAVEFKVGNVDLLKQAIEKAGMKILDRESTSNGLTIVDSKGQRAFIDLTNSQIRSRNMTEKVLSSFTNQIKRSYSEQVIDEIAKRNKWMKKKMGDNRFQLQRF
jgi:hypothetical protein